MQHTNDSFLIPPEESYFDPDIGTIYGPRSQEHDKFSRSSCSLPDGLIKIVSMLNIGLIEKCRSTTPFQVGSYLSDYPCVYRGM